MSGIYVLENNINNKRKMAGGYHWTFIKEEKV